MAKPPRYTEEEIREGEQTRAVSLPIWQEALVGLDWVQLRTSSVYRGADVDRGDGSAVVLVPGFLFSDVYLGELQRWLRRIGYQPFMSGIGRNMDCPNVLAERLHETIELAAEQTGGKVHLIGHSLGGVLARSAAVRWPDLVASVITLASPFLGIHAHPLVLRAQSAVRGLIRIRASDRTATENCYTGKCECEFVKALKRPFIEEIPQTAIYTKSDGVVDWQRCITGNPSNDIEVSGTHSGMAFNPEVYRHIAGRLALAQEPATANPN